MSQYVTKIRTDAGDLPIDYNALANLPALNTMFSNPNLLINSDFRNPVNQRGQTTLTTNDDEWTKFYFIDRWYSQHGTIIELLDGYIKASASATTTAGYFCQIFEKALPADNYTATVSVKSISGTVKMFLKNANGTSEVVLSNGINILTTNAAVSSIEIQLMPSASVELYWIKLEQGAIATPFVPRLYGEELALCRRYYRNDVVRLVSYQHTSTYAYFGYNYEPMRTAPTFSYVGFGETSNHAGATAASTAVQALEGTAVDRMAIRIVFSDTNTAYYRYASGRVILDAEIY